MSGSKVLLYGRTPEGKAVPLEAQYRNLYMCHSLAALGHEVHLDLPVSDSIRNGGGCENIHFPPGCGGTAGREFNDYDVVIVPLELFPAGLRCSVPLVINLQGPVFSATMPRKEEVDFMDSYYFGKRLAESLEALRVGDYFICAGPAQRMFYLGMLNMAGRSNSLSSCDGDSLVGIVSPGVALDPPVKTGEALAGVTAKPDSPVLLWPSGVYPWYDPFPVVEAFKDVLARKPGAALVFAGAYNPSAGRICKENCERLKSMVASLDLAGKVHFVEWLPYDQRANLYMESTIGICTYHRSFETELSWRSRIVDMLWGELPVILSGGDDLSCLVREYDAGTVLESNDADAIRDAILSLLSDGDRLAATKENVRKLNAERLDWKRNVEPLHEFCSSPRIARDRQSRVLTKCVRSHIRTVIRSGVLERAYMKYHLVMARDREGTS